MGDEGEVPGSGPRGEVRKGCGAEVDAALARWDQPSQQAQQGGLAGPIWPEDRGHASRMEGTGEIAQHRRTLGVGERETLTGKGGIGHARWYRSARSVGEGIEYGGWRMRESGGLEIGVGGHRLGLCPGVSPGCCRAL